MTGFRANRTLLGALFAGSFLVGTLGLQADEPPPVSESPTPAPTRAPRRNTAPFVAPTPSEPVTLWSLFQNNRLEVNLVGQALATRWGDNRAPLVGGALEGVYGTDDNIVGFEYTQNTTPILLNGTQKGTFQNFSLHLGVSSDSQSHPFGMRALMLGGLTQASVEMTADTTPTTVKASMPFTSLRLGTHVRLVKHLRLGLEFGYLWNFSKPSSLQAWDFNGWLAGAHLILGSF